MKVSTLATLSDVLIVAGENGSGVYVGGPPAQPATSAAESATGAMERNEIFMDNPLSVRRVFQARRLL
jgi:hypothetical protein